jgi:YtkA-like
MTMAKAGTPETDRERGAVRPIVVIAGVAVVAFVVALLVMRGSNGSSNVAAGGGPVPTVGPGPTGACGEGTPDPSYTLTTDSDPNPPRVVGTTFHLTVKHNGTAVTGAKVCVAADMPTMLHAGISETAKEVSGGRYDVDLKFSMDGSWAGTVTIAQPGQRPVSVPLAIQVAPS